MTLHRALIVEDDPELSLLFSDILAERQWQTEIEHDGGRVLDHIQKGQPDIVLLDLHLPHMSGLEILRRLRTDKQTQHLRVMAITANPNLAYEAQTLADLVLLKPVSYDQLVMMVERLVNLHKP